MHILHRFFIFPLRQNWLYVVAVVTFALASCLGLGSQALSQVGLSTGEAFIILSAMFFLVKLNCLCM